MADENRIEILVNGEKLDYRDVSDFGIKMNRIVTDFNDISKRFGDFSYTFVLPITKNNSRIFKFADAHARKNIFKPNRDLPCLVYHNGRLLLDGVISLQSVTRENYKCVFYSKLKEFIDTIEDLNLRDLNFDSVDFNYETTIINHINANYVDSDSALYQFPLTFYSTYYCQHSIYNGLNDLYGNAVIADQVYQNFYYMFNSVFNSKFNRFFHHQFPPAFYIVRIMEQIFKDAGWTLGGQFWNDANIKKIVMLYSGEQDIYDQATGEVSGSGTVSIKPAKLLPEMKQSDFIKGIVNTFNLYFTIDIQNKIIKFEPYNTFFGDLYNPYDITDKVFFQDVDFVYEEKNNPSILFSEAGNRKILGDNTVITGTSNNLSTITYNKVSGRNYDRFFNHIGDTGEITLPFGEPNMKKTLIYNDYNVGGSYTNADAHVMFSPIVSSQTPEDNDNKPFNKNSGHTYVYNTEDTVKPSGKPVLAFYLGQSDNDFINKALAGDSSDYYYFNMYTGLTRNMVKAGIATPFQLSSYMDEIDSYLSNPLDGLDGRRTVASTYLKTNWLMMGKTGSTYTGPTTDFSLVFDDDGYFHETLWTKFHKPMYDRLAKGEVLESNMRMDEYDWQEMRIDRPIKYNNEIYHILELKGYDPIKGECGIRLIKSV